MEQKDFCVACAERIKKPFKTKSDIQIYKICIEGIKIPVDQMFDDKDVYALFKNTVWADVYKFVRDNQEIFQGRNNV